MADYETIKNKRGQKLAYIYSPGTDKDLPTVMFCGGYRSDMCGTKATWLEEQCKKRGQGYIRFDYSGHGRSDGDFEQGTIGQWMDDALMVLDHVLKGPVLVVGSSMGGWIGLLLLKHRKDRVSGFVGIAAAPDFTRTMYEHLNAAQKEEMQEKGVVYIPNDYSDEPYSVTKALIDDGEKHCLLDEGLDLSCPVILIQGKEDKDVPWQTAEAIKKALCGGDKGVVEIEYIEDGAHNLSRPEDLARIDAAVKKIPAL